MVTVAHEKGASWRRRGAIWYGVRFATACQATGVTYRRIRQNTSVSSDQTLTRLRHCFKGNGRPVERKTATEITSFFLNKLEDEESEKLREKGIDAESIVVPSRWRLRQDFKALAQQALQNEERRLQLIRLGRPNNGIISRVSNGHFIIEEHAKSIASLVHDAQKQHMDSLGIDDPLELFEQILDDLSCFPQAYAPYQQKS